MVLEEQCLRRKELQTCSDAMRASHLAISECCSRPASCFNTFHVPVIHRIVLLWPSTQLFHPSTMPTHLIKCTAILCDHAQFSPKMREYRSVRRMCLADARYVRANGIDGRVNEEGILIEETRGPGLWEDGAVLIDEEEVSRLQESPMRV